MTEASLPDPERRVLLLAPTAKDAEASRQILAAAGVDSLVCKDLAEVCAGIGRGGGAALLTQEAILSDRDGRLVAALAAQPAWSDFPLIVLTPAGPDSAAAGRALEAVGHMTLVKRPVPIQTLVSTVRAALRDRLRQYAARDDIARREAHAEAIRRREAEFRQLADAMPQIVWTARPDGRLDYYNKRWYELTGLPEGSVGDDGWLPVIHPDDAPRCLEAWYKAVGAAEPYEIEYRFRDHRDGGYRWQLGRALPAKDDAGRVVKWFGTSTDIDDRKRAEEAADRRTRQLQRLAEVFPRLNSAHDVRSVLRVVTEEARDLIGARQARTVMTPDPDRPQAVDSVSLSDHDAESEWRGPDADLAGGTGAPPGHLLRPVRMTRAEMEADPDRRARAGGDGRAAPASGWLAVPLAARDGRNLGQIQLSDRRQGEFTENDEALLVQLAHLASAAVESARLYEELRGNDRRKDEFLAMLAHELRNPLAAINNAVRVSGAPGTGAGGETGWSLGVVDRQVRHLSRLIDDLLDVSRITGGKIQLRRKVIDPYPVLAAAVEAVRPLAEERRHEIITSIGPGHWVDADPTRLEQILVNLLTNSAKYTESGGHIWLAAGREGGEYVVSVRDDGVGIPPDKLPRMFDLFAQGDRTLARSEGGLGIGLTLVRSLAEMHGGTVTATSGGDGRGSEFLVRLPAAPAPTGGGPAAPAKRDRPAVAPARVLIVDDNVDSACGMAKLLKRLGHDVRTAHDGPAAVDAADDLLPEVVLLDIGLPGMNGYEVAARLRADDRFRRTLIIAVSGYGQDDDRRRSKAAGFDHHLVKPVDHDDLLSLLSGALPAG